MILSLSDGAAPLPLDTNVRRAFFSLGHALEALREGDGAFRLRTLEPPSRVLAVSEEAFYERFAGTQYKSPRHGSPPSEARQPKTSR